ncbi:hypothetical protein [Fodinicola acaciae]|uniref:hypothetical protein n=1 Tax=Fodinicola acaciae TaxID=2681555 RepID=UPI0013CF9569|nr:hypothetical protein [Fodinicola acaciae]
MRTYRWICAGYLVAAAVLTVWTVGLLFDQPPDIVTWVGLDGALVVAFLLAARLAHRGDPRLGLVAAATGAAVLLDGWFDVTTAEAGWLGASILLAVTVEGPFVLASAAIAGWTYRRVYAGTS